MVEDVADLARVEDLLLDGEGLGGFHDGRRDVLGDGSLGVGVDEHASDGGVPGGERGSSTAGMDGYCADGVGVAGTGGSTGAGAASAWAVPTNSVVPRRTARAVLQSMLESDR